MTAPNSLAEQQLAVLATYQKSTVTLRDQLTAFITALWQSLGTYRNAQIADFTGQAVPVVDGALQQMQALTSGYLATLASLNGGSLTPTAGPAVDISSLRNGADPVDVYGRPFHLVWRQLADNTPLDGEKVAAAIQSGLDRAVQTAVTDVQLAKTHTARSALRDDRNITGYRRQIEGARTCALCIVASTRLYHKADLMPMHPACDCTPVPIFSGQPHNIAIDPEQLATVHDIIAAQFGADSTAARKIAGAFKDDGTPVLYRDVLITHDHGELGPVLAVRGQSHTHFAT